MSNCTVKLPAKKAYFMRDQVKRKVPHLMNETWFNGPVGAAFTLLALVTALSVLGGMGTAQAASSLSALGLG